MPWVIPGFIPGGRTILFARPKAGKSMLSMQLADAMTWQEPVLGFPPCPRPWRVLYVSLDAPAQELRSQCVTMGLRGGWGWTTWDFDEGNYLERYPFTTDQGSRRAWAQLREAGPEYIIWDGLTYFTTAGWSDETAKMVYARLLKVQGAQVPHLILGHDNKERGEEGDSRHFVQRLKGPIELLADCSAMWHLVTEDGQRGTLEGTGRAIGETVVPLARDGRLRWTRPAERVRPQVRL